MTVELSRTPVLLRPAAPLLVLMPAMHDRAQVFASQKDFREYRRTHSVS
jgi:hypothetical protein